MKAMQLQFQAVSKTLAKNSRTFQKLKIWKIQAFSRMSSTCMNPASLWSHAAGKQKNKKLYFILYFYYFKYFKNVYFIFKKLQYFII